MAQRKPGANDTADRPAAGTRGGGLFTGIFIGVLLGIAMALAVAVWLNLRGSPFAERDQPTELPALKTPAEPAAAPKSPAPEAGADGAPPVEPDSVPSGAAPAPAAPERGAQRFDFYDILPRSGTATEPPPRVPLPVGFYLQAGAFRNPSEADDRKAHLALLGQTAVVQRVQSDGGMLHRIRVGPFATHAELERAREFLKTNGIDSIPMRPEAATTP